MSRPLTEEEFKVISKKLPPRKIILYQMINMMVVSGQPFDICFQDCSKPILEAKPDKIWVDANSNETSISVEGRLIRLRSIRCVYPMPKEGFEDGELGDVDMSEAEEIVPNTNGMTLRQVIRDSYKCATKDEENVYLRRYIAS